jgi:hypothetical protein
MVRLILLIAGPHVTAVLAYRAHEIVGLVDVRDAAVRIHERDSLGSRLPAGCLFVHTLGGTRGVTLRAPWAGPRLSGQPTTWLAGLRGPDVPVSR